MLATFACQQTFLTRRKTFRINTIDNTTLDGEDIGNHPWTNAGNKCRKEICPISRKGFYPWVLFSSRYRKQKRKECNTMQQNKYGKQQPRKKESRETIHIARNGRWTDIYSWRSTGGRAAAESGDIIEGYNTVSLSMTLASYMAVWSGVGDVIPIAGYTITLAEALLHPPVQLQPVRSTAD